MIAYYITPPMVISLSTGTTPPAFPFSPGYDGLLLPLSSHLHSLGIWSDTLLSLQKRWVAVIQTSEEMRISLGSTQDSQLHRCCSLWRTIRQKNRASCARIPLSIPSFSTVYLPPPPYFTSPLSAITSHYSPLPAITRH